MSIKATEIRKGMVIVHNGELHQVTDYEHIAPGNWRAINQVKLKNLKTGNAVHLRLSSSDNVEQAYLETKPCQYLYHDPRQGFMFMDLESYEQYHVSDEVIGDKMKFVREEQEVKLTFHEGAPLSIDLPSSVVLTVAEAEPAARGNSVTNVFKKAITDTGLEVRVPNFIEPGEQIKISTDTGEFQGRAKD